MTDIAAHFQKHNLKPTDILYVYRHNKKTAICCADGNENFSVIPVHEIQAYLPDTEFISIAKGVIVCRSRIVHISNDGIYTMTDGRTFQGRRRNLSAHRRLRRELKLDAPFPEVSTSTPSDFFGKYSILDEMPIAYCIIELVFDRNGHGVDFVFRYCNHHMEVVEGIPIPEMLNRSFYDVFKDGDRKWLVSYADVALNGTKCTLHDYSPEIKKNLTIHCYQPEPGFCACILLPD